MKNRTMKCIPMAIATALGGTMAVSAASAAELNGLTWYTVVNNGDVMPDSTKKFNAYNQPSVNNLGDVVFRARSKGGEGGGGEGESLISIADEGGGFRSRWWADPWHLQTLHVAKWSDCPAGKSDPQDRRRRKRGATTQQRNIRQHAGDVQRVPGLPTERLRLRSYRHPWAVTAGLYLHLA